MSKQGNLIMAELRDLTSRTRDVRTDVRAVHGRPDTLDGRIDTMIDALAELRTDFDRHTHD